MQHRIVGTEAQRGAIAVLGLRHQSQLLQHAAQVALRLLVPRRTLHRLTQRDGRLLKPAVLAQHQPYVVVQVRQVGLVPHRVAVGLKRLLRPSQVAQHMPHHLARSASPRWRRNAA